MAIATLQAIRTKVRRLTRSPSVSSISDNDIDEYVNTFIAYDFPEHLRLFSLRTTFTFYCNPYQDVYITDDTLPVGNPLKNFKNNYITVHPPVYIAGYDSFYSQSPEQFFGIYPKVDSIVQVGMGDGVTTAYAGTLPATPVMLNEVLFSSTDINYRGLAVKDVPDIPFDGSGVLIDANTLIPVGSMSYITGNFTINFPTAPGAGVAINAQTVPYQPQIPQAMLYYDDKFTLRPIPDQPYAINFEVYIRPTQLLLGTSIPDLEQWWQYIAYGASIKLLQDRLEHDMVQLLLPEFKLQERLVNRRTIVQQTNDRSATIYTEQVGITAGGFGFGGGQF